MSSGGGGRGEKKRGCAPCVEDVEQDKGVEKSF